MFENLRNQDRLSWEEEERIDKKIRIAIIAVMVTVVVIILWMAFQRRSFGKGYYAFLLTLLACVWLVKYVLGGILKHSLAGRTDEEVSAYLKAAGLELVAYAGLGWFLLAMSGTGILGAAVYVFGITTARRQLDIYYGVNKDKEEEEAAAPDSPAVEADPEGEVKALEEAPEEGGQMSALPSAADRQQREKEQDDGSV